MQNIRQSGTCKYFLQVSRIELGLLELKQKCPTRLI